MISIPRIFGNYLDSSFFNDAAENKLSLAAKTDIHETEKDFVITMDLPGFKKTDIAIEVTADNLVHISGKRETGKEEKNEKCHLRERQTMEFSRTFRMPKDIQHNAVGGSFEDGVLALTLPKAEKQVPDKVKVTLK